MQRSSLVSVSAVLAVQLSLPVQAEEGHAHDDGAAGGMPRLSLVLDAQYARDNQDGEGHEVIEEAAGILHGVHFHEDDHGQENGFGLGASELAVEADLPSQLKARLSLALNVDEIELEEAWVQTQGLPSGLSVKAGRFLSGIGYLNGQHPHEQDFASGNLVYTSLLGPHGVLDTGVQLTWQAPVPFFLQIGAEALQGHEQERFGALVDADEADSVVLSGAGLADKKDGPRTGTLFLEAAPYLGEQHSLQFGLSWARAGQFQQVLDEDDVAADDQFALEGRQTLWGLDMVYEHDAEGREGAGDLELVAEYLWLEKDMKVTGADAGAEVVAGDRVSGRQDGVYVQAMVGVAPRWQAGLRHEVVGLKNELKEGGERLSLKDSQRTSLVLSYRPTAASRLRLQLSSADIHDEDGEKTRLEQVSLGYTVTLGSHEGHAH